MPSPLAPKEPIPGITPGTVDYTGDKPKPSAQTSLPGAIGGLLGSGLSGNPVDALNPFAKITNTLGNVYLWKRVGIFVLGSLFLWWGILIIISTNKTIQNKVLPLAKDVISKTPEGAAANVAAGAIGE